MDRATNWDLGRQAIIDDIVTYGWHCANSLANWDKGACCYTVGLFEKFHHPELAVFGLKPSVGNMALVRAVQCLRSAGGLKLTGENDELLTGCPAIFLPVAPADSAQFFDALNWYYADGDVPVLQIVWPSLKRHYPWHAEPAACVKAGQPLPPQLQRGRPSLAAVR